MRPDDVQGSGDHSETGLVAAETGRKPPKKPAKKATGQKRPKKAAGRKAA